MSRERNKAFAFNLIFVLTLFLSCDSNPEWREERTIYRTLIFGHRGSAGTHPENTLPAFEEAREAQADGVELDLQLSKDNVPIIWHDPDILPEICLYRTGKRLEAPKPIRKLLASQIKSFDCGSLPHPDYPDKRRIPLASIPTLEDFLVWHQARASHLQFNLDVKLEGSSPDLIPAPSVFAQAIVALLIKYKVTEKAIFTSFEEELIIQAKRMEPNLRFGLSFVNDADFCLLGSALGVQFIAPADKLVTQEIVNHCHEKGISVLPWVVNDSVTFERLLSYGVDGLETDFPRHFILRRNQY